MPRIPKDVMRADTPEMGIHVQVAECSDRYGQGYAVLLGLQSEFVPRLLHWEVDERYPYRPPKIRFLSKVPHPLISDDDGSIALDILGAEWSPALTLRTLLVALQAVVTEPELWAQEGACVVNASWKEGSLSTPQQHHPQLFAILLEASRPSSSSAEEDGGSQDLLDWSSWRCLAALLSSLREEPRPHLADCEEWYTFLRSLLPALEALQRQPAGASGEQQQWLVAAHALLDECFRLDGLRALLRARALGRHLGALSPVMRVWEVIQPFLSDIPPSQLFAGRN